MYYYLAIIGFVITLVAQLYVQFSYSKYIKINNKKLISGAEVARKILEANGLGKLYVVETKETLSDHYDPISKVVRLSHDVYNGENIAAASIAAHEVGHAIQDKNKYPFLKFRSFILPFVNIGSKFGYIAIVIGLIFGFLNLAYIGIILLCLMLLFQLITLPVEFNASKIADQNLRKLDILTKSEMKLSKKMLNAAAFTYVASLLTTILQILRLFLMVDSRRD